MSIDVGFGVPGLTCVGNVATVFGMDTTQQTHITQFHSYVMDFYGPDSSLYPDMQFTADEVTAAIRKHAVLCLEGNPNYTWGGGDSIDRERVRDLVLVARGETPWGM